MQQQPSPDPGLSRRAFLTAGSVTMGTAWLLGPAALAAWADAPVGQRGSAALSARPDALARERGSATWRLSVGFVEGAARLADATGRGAVPATQPMPSLARVAAGAVRVRVSGLTPATPPTVRGVAVEVLLQAPDARHEPLAFHAWSTAGATRVSSPVAFTAPVGRDPTFGLAVDRDRPTGAGSDRAVALFTGGRGDGGVQLREGLYLLGLQPGLWDRPRQLPALDDAAWTELASVVVAVGPLPGPTPR